MQGVTEYDSNPLFLFCTGLGKTTCPTLYHLGSLLKGHVDLLAHRDQTLGQMHVVLLQNLDRNENKVYVAKHQGTLLGITLLLPDKGTWVVSPVATGIQMMRSMVAVIEREAIALFNVSPGTLVEFNAWKSLTGTSINVILERKSESGSLGSTSACWPQFPTMRPIRMTVSGRINVKSVARELT